MQDPNVAKPAGFHLTFSQSPLLNHAQATQVLQTSLCCALHLEYFPNSICHTPRSPPFPFLNVTSSSLPFPVPSLSFETPKYFVFFIIVLMYYVYFVIQMHIYTDIHTYMFMGHRCYLPLYPLLEERVW